MHPLDWAIVALYVLFALGVGAKLAKRAGSDVDEFFLSGRSLAWWVTGTSMVATSFAADTPLLITGWVRDYGIWKNWAWWCFAVSGTLQVFLFARWWRRGGVMTKAELAELRYGGRGARVLRGILGGLHAGVYNTLVLCWVLLAAGKILDTLLGMDRVTGLVIASVLALSYALLAGFWGVVVTDMVQFVMAMVGGIALAVFSWQAIGSAEPLHAAIASGALDGDILRFLPDPGAGGLFDASFWTTAVAATFVYLGVSWWAVESVDGSTIAVQRIAASRDERQGLLAVLWFNFAHYALRPWCWIPVALASLLVFPTEEVVAPANGTIVRSTTEAITFAEAGGDLVIEMALVGQEDDGWDPLPLVEEGAVVAAGDVLARTDSERAYVAMMRRFLPVGLLGLVAASLLAAFMSTIDTHVNLAASFFVNDVYRRFWNRDASSRHYVLVARLASAVVLVLAGVMAWQSDSISELFLFFLAFLSGVGPVYILRWLWWRVRASTEIAAMTASALTTSGLKLMQSLDYSFPATVLSPGGVLSAEGRLILVVAVSLAVVLVELALSRPPDPRELVPFYRRVRPAGWWGPVGALCPDITAPRELPVALLGTLGGLCATFGAMLGIGFVLLDRPVAAATAGVLTIVGGLVTWQAVARTRH